MIGDACLGMDQGIVSDRQVVREPGLTADYGAVADLFEVAQELEKLY